MTLAEVLVTLLLVGLLSSGALVLGTSSARMASRASFDAECEALRDALNAARDQALMQDAARDAIVTIYSDGYTVKTWDDREERYISKTTHFEKVRASSAKGAINPNYRYEVRFYSKGTINKGQTIRLNGSGQQRCSLVLQPVTGRIWLSR